MAVLENQNKALIEELKSLKELYTGGREKYSLLKTVQWVKTLFLLLQVEIR